MKALLPEDINRLSLSAQAKVLLQCAPSLEGKLLNYCELGDFSPKDALIEVLRFMSLLGRSYVLTPSRRVDDVWHQFILHTLIYHEYCTKCYDKYLHHTPSNDSLSNEKQFEQTILRYREKFGDPPQWFWGLHWPAAIAGDCSACESA